MLGQSMKISLMILNLSIFIFDNRIFKYFHYIQNFFNFNFIEIPQQQDKVLKNFKLKFYF